MAQLVVSQWLYEVVYRSKGEAFDNDLTLVIGAHHCMRD